MVLPFLCTSGSHLNLIFFTSAGDTSGTERAVQRVRVLVANRPRLMRDLVLATVGDQPDIEIVGETQDEAEITELVERMRPDYLIVSSEQPEVRREHCR